MGASPPQPSEGSQAACAEGGSSAESLATMHHTLQLNQQVNPAWPADSSYTPLAQPDSLLAVPRGGPMDNPPY